MIRQLGTEPPVDRSDKNRVLTRERDAGTGWQFPVGHCEATDTAREFPDPWHPLAMKSGRIGKVTGAEAHALPGEVLTNQAYLSGVCLISCDDVLDPA